jgi:hypothetical protein
MARKKKRSKAKKAPLFEAKASGKKGSVHVSAYNRRFPRR